MVAAGPIPAAPIPPVSKTLTVALWLCLACIVVGVLAFVLGYGGVLAADIEFLGVKLGAGTAVGIVLVVIGVALFATILKNWPPGVRPWSMLTRRFP